MIDKIYKFLLVFCIVLFTVLVIVGLVRLCAPVETDIEPAETSNASYEKTSETVPALVTLDLTMTEIKKPEKKKIVPEVKIEEPVVEVEEDLEAEPVEVAEGEPEVVVDPEELELLACVIYQEAGSDKCCDDCRRRVADVVLNRMASEWYPDTMYEVLTQPSQYGRFAWTGVVWPDRVSDPDEEEAVARARRIAQEVLSGQHSDLYGEGYIFQAEFIQGSEWVYCEQCDIYFGRK